MSAKFSQNAKWLLPTLIIAALFVALVIKRLSDNATDTQIAVRVETPPAPVRAVEATRGHIREWIYGQGTARAVRREYLTFESEGRVTFIKRNEDGSELREGDHVRGPLNGDAHGEILASLDDRDQVEQINVAEADVVQALERENSTRAALEQAEAQRDVAVANLRRNQELLNEEIISQSQFETIDAQAREAEAAVDSAQAEINAAHSVVNAARARLNQAQVANERTNIFAPFDGVVAYVNVREGYYAAGAQIDTTSEERLLRTVPIVVIDPSQYEILIEIPSFYAGEVEEGQRAVILIDEPTGEGGHKSSEPSIDQLMTPLVEGHVFAVSPGINPGGRSVIIKVRTDRGAERLRDGMFISCWIVTEEKPDAVRLPLGALIFRGDNNHAYVVDEETGIAERRELEIGIASFDGAEIISGIEEGEVVVTEGRSSISDGTLVEVIEVEAFESSLQAPEPDAETEEAEDTVQ